MKLSYYLFYFIALKYSSLSVMNIELDVGCSKTRLQELCSRKDRLQKEEAAPPATIDCELLFELWIRIAKAVQRSGVLLDLKARKKIHIFPRSLGVLFTPRDI